MNQNDDFRDDDADDLFDEALNEDGELFEGGPRDMPAEEGAKIDDSLEEGPGLKLEQLRGEAQDNYDKYLRAVAELENFKKRSLKERSDLLKYAGENLARILLDVVDNLDRAVRQPYPPEAEGLWKGVKLVLDSFSQILERHSIRSESGLGKLFDPTKQEALASMPNADQPAGTVLEEYRKTYYFKDKLLRPGQVVVAQASPAPSEPTPVE